MKNAAFHLNLLSEAEKMSSSPIRLRVMMPVLALLAVVGMLVWWGTLTTQAILVRAKTSSVIEELSSKKAAHAAIIDNMKLANEEAAELQQLEMYRGGCVQWGETFATIAEVMPVKMQLVRLEIPEPPPRGYTCSPYSRLTPPSPRREPSTKSRRRSCRRSTPTSAPRRRTRNACSRLPMPSGPSATPC